MRRRATHPGMRLRRKAVRGALGVQAPQSRRLILFIIEAASIILIAAFLYSSALNSLVFARWNLSFLQIASPSDVTMSGLASSPHILTAFSGGAISFSMIRNLALPAFDASKKIRSIIYISSGYIFVTALGIFGPLVFMLLFYFLILGGEPLLKYDDFASIFGVGSLGGSALALARRLEFLPRWPRLLATGIAGTFVILCFVYFVIMTVDQRSEEGYQPAGWTFDGVSDVCNQPSVLWMGEQSIVVRCFPLRNEAVIRDPGRIELRSGIIPTTKVSEFGKQRWIDRYLKAHKPDDSRRW